MGYDKYTNDLKSKGGVDNLEILSLLSREELVQLGVPIGHAAKILKEVQIVLQE